jgi:hypothetical protein
MLVAGNVNANKTMMKLRAAFEYELEAQARLR